MKGLTDQRLLSNFMLIGRDGATGIEPILIRLCCTQNLKSTYIYLSVLQEFCGQPVKSEVELEIPSFAFLHSETFFAVNCGCYVSPDKNYVTSKVAAKLHHQREASKHRELVERFYRKS